MDIEIKFFEECQSCFGEGRKWDYNTAKYLDEHCKCMELTPHHQLTDVGESVAMVVRHVLREKGLLSR